MAAPALSHPALGVAVANDRFDRGAAAELAFDGLGDAASRARDIDPELAVRRGVVARSDDAGEAYADSRSQGDPGSERIAIVGVAGQRLAVGDEMAALGAIERDLDA